MLYMYNFLTIALLSSRVTLEDPIATRAIFPGLYSHAERRVPLRYNSPQDVSRATNALHNQNGLLYDCK